MGCQRVGGLVEIGGLHDVGRVGQCAEDLPQGAAKQRMVVGHDEDMAHGNRSSSRSRRAFLNQRWGGLPTADPVLNEPGPPGKSCQDRNASSQGHRCEMRRTRAASSPRKQAPATP